METKNKNRKPCLCKTCFWKWRDDKEDWCQTIEDGHGGSIKADRTECDLYRKEGTEPVWKCAGCGKNVFGESATGEDGKWWCNPCRFKMEHKKSEKEKKEKYKKIATEILEIFKKYNL